LEEIDYDKSKKVYEDYSLSYTNSYLVGIIEKFVIFIDQLETPSETLNIHALEEKGVMTSLNFFLEMLNPNKKMTLYAMPFNLTTKLKDFKDIKNENFWMVNG